MRHRTQLYLDEVQYRWIKQRAGEKGSIANVVRELIDAARIRRPRQPSKDPLIKYLCEDDAPLGRSPSTVDTIDQDLYG